jgi:ABC-type lipoprotein export system ATPase subunit
VRLPEAMRRRAGLTERALVQEDGGSVVLSGDGGREPEAPPVPELPAPLDAPSGPQAELRGIGVRFGERVVFDGFAARIDAGALTVVRGRSGAGKSTLLRLLLGLTDPDCGTVVLGGRELGPLRRPARADARRALVGVTTQSGALAEPLDTWENLALARAARGLPHDEAPARALVAALGLDAVSRRAVRLLSGGERQRVAIARSLVTQRPLVVLDEPTSQQDEAHAELLTGVLLAAARAGTAVVCATHDPVLAAAADHTIALT